MDRHAKLITAAGGNGTAIEVLDEPLTRAAYEARGVLSDEATSDGAEQAGFLILRDDHLEMAGGEFCGNASRAAAILLSEAKGRAAVDFSVSGFEGVVSADVTTTSPGHYHVRCEFPGMPTQVAEVTLPDGRPGHVVDLEGIVHVVIQAAFPRERAGFERAHRAITDRLGLAGRDAVGVIWCREDEDGGIRIEPVVWVKAMRTFFHETSCGSGAIAAAKVTGARSITQPSNKAITVEIDEDHVALSSDMELVAPTAAT